MNIIKSSLNLSLLMLLLWSCNTETEMEDEMEDANETETVVTDTNSDNMDAPENVKASFQTKYPDASGTQWTRYDPADDEGYKDEFQEAKLDTSYYKVRYNRNGVEYVTYYNPSGSWVRTLFPVENDKVPASIHTTIQKDYSGYSVVKVEEEDDDDGKKYEVKLKKGEDKLKLHFNSSGEVLKYKEKAEN